MKLDLKLPCDVYLNQMRRNLSSFTDFGQERFTGFVIGRFFMIRHHADYEWNRRITSETHSAMGFVMPNTVGTKVVCVRTAGALNPVSMLWLYCICLLVTLVRGFLLEATGVAMLIALIVTFVAAVFSAITDSLTEQGEAGSRMLTAFLTDPEHYYTHL